MAGARVLIAGNFHWQAGFSQTVAAYVEAAAEAGCEVRVSGPLSRMDEQIPKHLPVEPDVAWGTHLVFMFEARQYLSDEQIELACSIPRDRRLIIDFDGHWGGVATAGDSSVGTHSTENWQRLYSTLTDLVLQPKTGPLPDGAEFFPCFGMPGPVRHPLALGRERDRDLQYIGSNWGRWEPFVEVVEAARRAGLRRIRVCGRWWDDETCPGFEDITAAEPARLAGVEVRPPVPFGHVVTEMGRSLITPVLVSPLVADTGLLTARVFETLASGSLPVLPAAAEFLSFLYGGEAEPLLLGPDPAATLGRLAGDFERHAELVGRIQEQARARYNYPRLLTELLAFFR
ncbi:MULTISPECIES: glycosyltransferase family protein [Streptomyces]|uniref:glycosyltransferase family protein n=1 Tax=Streptomyces TaxID=1883 RepID=UPI00163BF3DA|nr:MULTISPECIES: hypothetical protein [Streptomyces]MBC2875759.1 hypothetical protein [Streptomyces sp. TYQ1024]UBI37611.1 hypothetical protein K7I03_14800 [Streptomyces mobaraensis]UKW30199.1 hypothetical protein MCU78_14765 [Streptomyces sp. TYQ1024]